MAVTLNESEKKALSELFSSIQNKGSFSDKIKNLGKNIKKFIKVYLKLNNAPVN